MRVMMRGSFSQTGRNGCSDHMAASPRGGFPTASTAIKQLESRLQAGRLRNRRQQPCQASTATQKLDATPTEPSDFLKGRMDFLRDDLCHLFDDKGIDKSAYEEKVTFQDPITNHNTLTGYLFNIQFLRYIFGPEFFLHDLRATGENEITSRWTMRMKLTINQISPLRKWWDPELLFTGVSIMSLNPETGRFNSHIDYWDAIENQKFLSLEAVQHVFSQLTTLSKPPTGLDTPDFLVMRKFKDCEVRRYEPFIVAEKDAQQSSMNSNGSNGSNGSSGSSSSSDTGRTAFRALADYIFGGNESQQKMKMTTPVFRSSDGRMQFVVGKADQRVEDLPSPNDASVQLKRQQGGYFAAISFSGVADEPRVQAELRRLREALPKHGLQATSDGYVVARYNDPSTKPMFRRNDILIELADFELW